jgi:hypothetical protein
MIAMPAWPMERRQRVWRARSSASLVAGMLIAASAVGCAGDASDGQRDERHAPLISGADGYLSDFGISCELDSREVGGQHLVRMTLRNRGGGELRFSPRGTAWDKGSTVFAVTGASGSKLQYRGNIAMRDGVSDAELLLSRPGEALSIDYDLSQTYALEQEGSISLRRPLLDVRLGRERLKLQHDCGTTVYVHGPEAAFAEHKQPLTYDGTCSDENIAQMESTKDVARAMLHGINDAIYAGRAPYTTWFGNGIQDHVADNFSSIGSNWDAQSIVCYEQGEGACEPDTNAYVNNFSFYGTVFICEKFWTLRSFSVEGASSRSGSFIHELSHTYAFTQDVEGDPEEAKQLAIDFPSQAVQNAESYERYAANQYMVTLATVLF